MPTKGSVWMYLKAALNASGDARLPQGRESLRSVTSALRSGTLAVSLPFSVHVSEIYAHTTHNSQCTRGPDYGYTPL